MRAFFSMKGLPSFAKTVDRGRRRGRQARQELRSHDCSGPWSRPVVKRGDAMEINPPQERRADTNPPATARWKLRVAVEAISIHDRTMFTTTTTHVYGYQPNCSITGKGCRGRRPFGTLQHILDARRWCATGRLEIMS